MTQFKFRGRRPNGEWVYGAYIPPEYTQLEYASIVTKEHRFDVDPESVGIFIGRTADGEEIYSGSQLEFSLEGQRTLGTVYIAGGEVRVGCLGEKYLLLMDLLLFGSIFGPVKVVEAEGKGVE
ncbi:MAG: hypothetical protein IJQ91_04155 [Acidaminococcaceae bacterium]|nr:hypothetical protein [Acidaminococcaceae bacterium]